MVPHKVTGMSLLSTLYGCEALLPEKIERTRYDSDEDYEKAVAEHRGDAGHLRASIEKLLPLFRRLGNTSIGSMSWKLSRTRWSWKRLF